MARPSILPAIGVSNDNIAKGMIAKGMGAA
jgi:hypothetical protein